MSDTDLELLARYTQCRAEDAFSEVVRRHLGLVYSAALRQVRSPQLAEEVAQSTFLKLATHAHRLAPDTVLSAWLYQVTRREAIDVVRREARRQSREQSAVEMNTMNANAADWTQIEPLLDDAMHALDDTDRTAVLLRFFEHKSLREVGQTLGTTDDTARKRVNRAIEHLREFFAKRGVTVGTSGLVVVISANAVQAAPVGLSTTIISAAFTGITAVAMAARTKAIALTKGLATSVLAILLLVPIVFYLQHRANNVAQGQSAGRFQPGLPAAPAGRGPSNRLLSAVPPKPPREPFTLTTALSLNTPPGALVLQPDGKILVATSVGGWFIDEASGTLGWYTRGAMRFEANGALDPSFFVDVGRPGSVNPMAAHLALYPDGRILLSGSFGSVDGQPRLGHAVLLPDGRVDETFEPWRGSTNVNPQTWQPGGPATGNLLRDGSVAVLSYPPAGSKTSWCLTAYRLDASGRIIKPTNSWPEFGDPPGLAQSLGWGGFWGNRTVDWNHEAPLTSRTWHPPGSQRPPVTHIPFDLWVGTPTALQAAMVFRTLFEEVPMELCRYAVRLPDGGVILPVREGGIRGHFMRFDKDWRPVSGFTNQFDCDTTSCLNLQRLPDGKLFVAGLVGKINGENVSGLIRLQPDGAIDHSFRCETSGGWEGRVLDFTIQKDGRIVICGYFSRVNGVDCQYLARVNADGSLDSTFQPPFIAQAEVDRRRFLRVASLAKKRSAGTTVAASATPTASSETILIISMKLEPESGQIHFTGKAGRLYILQGRETMNAEWFNIHTNRADPTGNGVLRDHEAGKSAMRFYRVATP